MKIRTSRGYQKESDLSLSQSFADTIKGFKDNPAFSDPPVSVSDMEKLKLKFDQAIIEGTKLGKLMTAKKDAVRAEVITVMDKNASYVDINCNNDLAVLLSSGYEEVDTNRASTLLLPPVIKNVVNMQEGAVRVTVKGDPNRRMIQGRCKAQGSPEWGPVITFATSRNILFTQLIKGTTYLFQLCGLGGSTGQSDWSEPVSKTAI